MLFYLINRIIDDDDHVIALMVIMICLTSCVLFLLFDWAVFSIAIELKRSVMREIFTIACCDC